MHIKLCRYERFEILLHLFGIFEKLANDKFLPHYGFDFRKPLLSLQKHPFLLALRRWGHLANLY